MSKICILTQSHICRNPRVWKEIILLNETGYQIKVLTCFYDNNLFKEDQELLKGINCSYTHYIDIRNINLYSFISKLLMKIGVLLVSIFRLNNVFALGYSPLLALNKAKKENADIYIVHQELATWVGVKLLKKKYKVFFDLEDWYSEDLLPSARKCRPLELLKKIESYALSNGVVWTTSKAMARQMAHAFNCKAPYVIYNSFPDLSDNQVKYLDRRDTSNVSIFWFSQTIGPGRGLEIAIEALNNINLPFELHLRGRISKDYKEYLERIFKNEKGNLVFHGLVSNKELQNRIKEHDIGLALEAYEPSSRNYTITNKILQYLQCGLAVIASDTEGQKEVAKKAPDSVLLYGKESDTTLEEQLRLLIENPKNLEKTKEKAIENYLNNFLWEHQSKKLIQIIQDNIQ